MEKHDNEAAHGLQAGAVKSRIDEQVQPVPPAVAEFVAGEREQLIGRVAELERELSALKAQPGGVVLPEHQDSDLRSPAHEYSKGWNSCIDEVARLNQQPASSGDERAAFSKAYNAAVDNGFDSVRDLAQQIWQARAALAQSERVPEGWQLVPVELTPWMYARCHLASGVAARVWRDLLAAAPSPSKQERDK